MSFAHDSPPSLSLFVRESNSVYASSLANESVVPPPERNGMRRAEISTILETVVPPPQHNDILETVVNHHSKIEPPPYTDFPQITDSTGSEDEDSTNIGRFTMKGFGLPEVLTAPETITIYEACCLMSAGRADAVVLTDSNALLSGILTNKDIVSRVIAAGIDFANTPASKVMTKNPIFVSSDANPVEALRKMVEEDVTQLPITENGEVVGIVRLAKCLADVAKSELLRSAEEEELVVRVLRMLARWNIELDT